MLRLNMFKEKGLKNLHLVILKRNVRCKRKERDVGKGVKVLMTIKNRMLVKNNLKNQKRFQVKHHSN